MAISFLFHYGIRVEYLTYTKTMNLFLDNDKSAKMSLHCLFARTHIGAIVAYAISTYLQLYNTTICRDKNNTWSPDK